MPRYLIGQRPRRGGFLVSFPTSERNLDLHLCSRAWYRCTGAQPLKAKAPKPATLPPPWTAIPDRVSPAHCSATPPPGNGGTNGVSEDKSDNQPDCEDECGIDSRHFVQTLHA